MHRIPWSYGCKIGDQFRLEALIGERDRFAGRLLDLGCGKKPYKALLGHRVDQWVGIDMPVTCSGIPSADIFASGLGLPFKAGVFDVVLYTEVLEHVPEPQVLLNEAARVLKPGGALVLSTPQAWPLHEAPHDYFRYTRYGLIYLAERAGFRVLRVKAFGGVLALIGQIVVSHIPLLHPQWIGRRLQHAASAGVQWAFWWADKLLHKFHDGSEEGTIGHLLVAEKSQEGITVTSQPAMHRS